MGIARYGKDHPRRLRFRSVVQGCASRSLPLARPEPGAPQHSAASIRRRHHHPRPSTGDGYRPGRLDPGTFEPDRQHEEERSPARRAAASPPPRQERMPRPRRCRSRPNRRQASSPTMSSRQIVPVSERSRAAADDNYSHIARLFGRYRFRSARSTRLQVVVLRAAIASAYSNFNPRACRADSASRPK